MSPRGDHLPPQDTDDSVKPLQVVRKQLVSISTPHLQKHRQFISTNLQRLDAVCSSKVQLQWKIEQNVSNTPSSSKNVSLTLFMSSDIISLGWAVLESSVTSTVSKGDKCEEMNIILYLICWLYLSILLSSCVSHTCILLYPPHPCRESFKMLLKLLYNEPV